MLVQIDGMLTSKADLVLFTSLLPDNIEIGFKYLLCFIFRRKFPSEIIISIFKRGTLSGNDPSIVYPVRLLFHLRRRQQLLMRLCR